MELPFTKPTRLKNLGGSQKVRLSRLAIRDELRQTSQSLTHRRQIIDL